MTRNPESANAEFTLSTRLVLRLLELVLTEEDRESLLGDLVEEHDEIARRHGPVRARWWLVQQALGSVGPIVWRRMTKAVSEALFAKPALRLQAVTQGANMFERSMLDGPGRRSHGRKWWLVPAAIAVHFTLFIGLAIARMWSLEELSEPVLEATYIPVMLPKQPPPPPKGGGPRRPTTPSHARAMAPQAPRQPVVSPIQIPEIVIPEPTGPDVPSDLVVDFGPTYAPGSDTGSPDGIDDGTGDGQGQDVPIPVGGNVRPPEVIRRVQPRYTRLAINAGIYGEVVLEATIDKQGNVVGARVLKGLGGGLNEESIRAVEDWKFKPATLNGRPVAVYFTVTVTFTLNHG